MNIKSDFSYNLKSSNSIQNLSIGLWYILSMIITFCVSKNMCFLSDDWIIQSWPEGLCQLHYFTGSLPQGNYVCIWCNSWPAGLVLLITLSSRWKAVLIFNRPITTHLQRPNFKSEGMLRREPASWHGAQGFGPNRRKWVFVQQYTVD